MAIDEPICFDSKEKKWTKLFMFLLIFMVLRVQQALIHPWQQKEHREAKVPLFNPRLIPVVS